MNTNRYCNISAVVAEIVRFDIPSVGTFPKLSRQKNPNRKTKKNVRKEINEITSDLIMAIKRLL